MVKKRKSNESMPIPEKGIPEIDNIEKTIIKAKLERNKLDEHVGGAFQGYAKEVTEQRPSKSKVCARVHFDTENFVERSISYGIHTVTLHGVKNYDIEVFAEPEGFLRILIHTLSPPIFDQEFRKDLLLEKDQFGDPPEIPSDE